MKPNTVPGILHEKSIKILSVIDSCTSEGHLKVARAMIDNFVINESAKIKNCSSMAKMLSFERDLMGLERLLAGHLEKRRKEILCMHDHSKPLFTYIPGPKFINLAVL